MALKLASILGSFGNRSDRYMTGGYASDVSLEGLFDSVTRIPELSGVELVGTWQLTADSVAEVREHLARTGLQPVSVIPDLFATQIWGKGSFAAHDAGVRRAAVDYVNEMAVLARAIDCPCVCIWPGQDGYDYPFQADYAQAFDWFAEGIRACAEAAPDVRFALEYKPKEPRNRSFLSTADRSTLFVKAIGLPNVGVTLDVGHALEAYESAAESVALLQREGLLAHVHLNDNYRLWDDDMIFGSVHPVELLEFVYWLRRTSYDGWCSFDQYPYREDPVRAIGEGAKWFRALEAIVEASDDDELDQLLRRGDAAEATAVVRRLLLGGGGASVDAIGAVGGRVEGGA
jgi:xylose isomerase